MSDVNLVGGGIFWNFVVIAILMVITLVVLPFGMMLLEVVGVKISAGVRTLAKRAMIACFVVLIGCVVLAVVSLN